MNENILNQKKLLGISLGIFLIVANIFAYFVSFLLKRTDVVTVENSNLITYILNAISIYIVGYGALKIILKDVETAPKKEKKKIKFLEILLLICIAIGGSQIANSVTQIVIGIVKLIFEIEINNNVTDLLQSSNTIYMIIFAAILGPIMEELIFRGTLMEKLRIYGDKTAIIYTAIAFGLFHCNFAQIPYAIVVGFVLGYIKVKTNSMVIPIILHMIQNSISVISMIAVQSTTWVIMLLILLMFFICIVLTIVFVPIKLAKNQVQISNESKYEKNNLYKNIGYIFSVVAIVILTIVSSIG